MRVDLLEKLTGLNLGDTVYEIVTDTGQWYGVGNEVNREPRLGFLAADQPSEWLSVDVYVPNRASEIPSNGISLFEVDGQRIGPDHSWFLVSRNPAGESLMLVRLSNRKP
jgi:hypothetical protein